MRRVRVVLPDPLLPTIPNTFPDSIVNENPGHVQTARGRAIASRALKRDMRPQDLLGALIFLASAESDFVTGQTIAVDGGNVNT